jgi:hypothetical protein
MSNAFGEPTVSAGDKETSSKGDASGIKKEFATSEVSFTAHFGKKLRKKHKTVIREIMKTTPMNELNPKMLMEKLYEQFDKKEIESKKDEIEDFVEECYYEQT